MHRWRVAVITALLLLGMINVSAGITDFDTWDKIWTHCKGKFKNKKPTPKELTMILNHIKETGTINLCRADLKNTDLSKSFLERVDLSGAYLDNANLSGANLRGANLAGASLDNVNLSGALLDIRVNLIGASMSHANLRNADLHSADISLADLKNADLSGADLSGANLSGANLTEANLSGTRLYETELSNADIGLANLDGTIFQPAKLPIIDTIAHTYNLSKMTFSWSPQALVKLRNSFKDAGYREQERAVTYAINHTRILKEIRNGRGYYLFNAVSQYVLFDFTTRWGMEPGHALRILIFLIPIFALPYGIVLILPGNDGLWCKWANDRIRLDLGTIEPTRLNVDWYVAVVTGLYFSLLSAFNI